MPRDESREAYEKLLRGEATGYEYAAAVRRDVERLMRESDPRRWKRRFVRKDPA